MKLALFSSVLCIILGVAIAVGAGAAYPFINSALNNLESTAASYLARADSALLNAQEAVNSTRDSLTVLSSATSVSLPTLTSSSQLANNIANNLTSIGSTVSGAGQTLSSISIAGVTPFTSVGNTISSIGQPITAAASSLQNVSSSINSLQQETSDLPSRIDSIRGQLDNMGNTLSDLRTSVVEAENSLPAYFSQIRLAALLAIAGTIGLGVIFLLIGISLFSLRRKTVELNKISSNYYRSYPRLTGDEV
jgi:uncharacterized protein YoxC